MLVNPYDEELATFDGTRLLKETYGIVGKWISDPVDPHRRWSIQGLYAPIPRRSLGGIRARLLDSYGFVTFVNQRDLEVLLGIGDPGKPCQWMARSLYLHPLDKDWCGLCMDSSDLMDDLLDREFVLRCSYPPLSQLPEGLQMGRLLHMDNDTEVEETLVLAWDIDPVTGETPDTKLSTVENRWVSVAQKRI